MELEYFIRCEIHKINIVDDIYEMFKIHTNSKLNSKIFESNISDNHYEQLYQIKKELQIQINLCKCKLYRNCFVLQLDQKLSVNPLKSFSDAEFQNEELLINLACKYLELFLAILNFEEMSEKSKIKTKNSRDITSTQSRALESKLVFGEDKYGVNSNFEKINNNTPKNKEIKRNFNMESWICWFTKCQRTNFVKDKFCEYCRLDRQRPQFDFDFILKYSKNNKDHPKLVWVCRKCDTVNDKDKLKCEGFKCRELRFSSATKALNKVQTKNDKNIEDFWFCKRCTFKNNVKDEFCDVCYQKSEILKQ